MGTLAVETKPLHGIKRVPQCNHIGSTVFQKNWCTCMAIDVSVHINGGFLPDIILASSNSHARTRTTFIYFFPVQLTTSRIGNLTYIHTVYPMLLPSKNPFKCHEEFLSLQPIYIYIYIFFFNRFPPN